MIRMQNGWSETARPRQSRRRVAAWMLLFLTGCDGLLDVKLPGDLQDSDLDDPRLANTLALSAQGEFECAFSSYVWAMGLWAGDFHTSGNTRTNVIVANRLSDTWKQITPVETECVNTNPPPLWLPLQTARTVAEDAIRRYEAYPDGEAPANLDFLIGKAAVFAGYGRQLLSETFCQLTFDAGPPMSREEAFGTAEERFTRAIGLLSGITSGPHANEARQLLNAALVGRARARLNRGDGPGAVADASRVETNFVMSVTRSTTDLRRYNMVHYRGVTNREITVTESYRGLTVDGVPDPRVPVVSAGLGLDGATPLWHQRKMTSRDSPMPFSSWREAQLMIAEVEGGQRAVDIINLLRATHGLPRFSSADPDAIRRQVLEERRRELWLQGTRLGDMLRTGQPFLSGVDPRGGPYGDGTCLPFPVSEEIGNPHIRG